MNNNVKICLTVVTEGSILVRQNGELVNKKSSQHISMTKEAYDNFISNNCITDTYLPKTWAKMTKQQRLEYHMKRTAEYFKATSYSYEVLED